MAAEASHRIGHSRPLLWLGSLAGLAATTVVAVLVPHLVIGDAGVERDTDAIQLAGRQWQVTHVLCVASMTVAVACLVSIARHFFHRRKASGRAMLIPPPVPKKRVDDDPPTFLGYKLSPAAARRLSKAKYAFRVFQLLVSGLQHAALAFIPDSMWNMDDVASRVTAEAVSAPAGRIGSLISGAWEAPVWAAIAFALLALVFTAFVVLAMGTSAVVDPWAEGDSDNGLGVWAQLARWFPFLTRDFLTKVPGGVFIVRFLTSTVFVFVFGSLLSAVDCTWISGGGGAAAWALDADPSVPCWTARHALVASVAMVVLAPYTLSSFATQLMLVRVFDDDEELRVSGAYALLSLSVQIVCTSLGVLIAVQPYIPLVSALVCELALWVWTTFVHDPTPSSVGVRALVAGGHGVATVSHVAAIVSRTVSTRKSLVPLYIFWGNIVIITITCVAVSLQRKREARSGSTGAGPRVMEGRATPDAGARV
jgi:hypothetical protein